MFTGIIETVGLIKDKKNEGKNVRFLVESAISNQLKVDQSVTHNGVCLTVTAVEDGAHWVTVVDETLKKSNLGGFGVRDQVNIERSMLVNGRFDGHIVQGHVDGIGFVKVIEDVGGSWLFQIQYPPESNNITVEKGSVAVNGVSLTCFDSAQDGFSVTIIPYTYENTTFSSLKVGDSVNLEFDIIGKYVSRLMRSAR